MFCFYWLFHRSPIRKHTIGLVAVLEENRSRPALRTWNWNVYQSACKWLAVCWLFGHVPQFSVSFAMDCLVAGRTAALASLTYIYENIHEETLGFWITPVVWGCTQTRTPPAHNHNNEQVFSTISIQFNFDCNSIRMLFCWSTIVKLCETVWNGLDRTVGYIR